MPWSFQDTPPLPHCALVVIASYSCGKTFRRAQKQHGKLCMITTAPAPERRLNPRIIGCHWQEKVSAFCGTRLHGNHPLRAIGPKDADAGVRRHACRCQGGCDPFNLLRRLSVRHPHVRRLLAFAAGPLAQAPVVGVLPHAARVYAQTCSEVHAKLTWTPSKLRRGDSPASSRASAFSHAGLRAGRPEVSALPGVAEGRSLAVGRPAALVQEHGVVLS